MVYCYENKTLIIISCHFHDDA
ncbi:hypothetical protein LU290_02925 [Moraxella nasibovis]|nr:hypothetical protein LU290_02925 [Moraxella nasibovis]